MYAKILKANPYHDKAGKFTSKDKAGSVATLGLNDFRAALGMGSKDAFAKPRTMDSTPAKVSAEKKKTIRELENAGYTAQRSSTKEKMTYMHKDGKKFVTIKEKPSSGGRKLLRVEQGTLP